MKINFSSEKKTEVKKLADYKNTPGLYDVQSGRVLVTSPNGNGESTILVVYCDTICPVLNLDQWLRQDAKPLTGVLELEF